MTVMEQTESATPAKVELKRTLGLFSGCGIILGTIIGSGIFVSPKGVIHEAGSPGMSLIVWTLAGLFVLCGSLCFAELGTFIPKSGGPFAFILEAFGDLPAFLYLWMIVVIATPGACAVISLTFAYYVLQPIFMNCQQPEDAVRLLAASAVCLLTFVNAASVKWASRVQNIFMVIKIFALVIIIIGGIFFLVIDEGSNLVPEQSFESTTQSPGKVAVAIYTGLFSYSGWECITFITEELKEPNKNLPRAIIISVPLVTGIYVLTNAAYFAVLTPAEILGSQAVAVTFAMKICYPLAWAMPIFVACSTFGSLNGSIMSVGRVFFVGARQGHLPIAIALINLKVFTPMPSIIIEGGLTLVMLSLGNVYQLITYTIFAVSLSHMACAMALLYFRWKRPHEFRPVKVPLAIAIVFLVVCVFLLVLNLVTAPMETGISLLAIASGIPIFLIGVKWKNKPAIYYRYLKKVTRLIQKTTYCVPQE